MTPQEQIWIRRWYWSGAFLILLTLIVGGVTRLTGSGLSMVEWRPLMGILPPLSEGEWQKVFDQYRQYPEYLYRNQGMSLADFQFIFFWEYLHRMMGRLIGLVFLIPFGWFLWNRSFSPRELRRAMVLLGLGLGQGFMGWYMVQSGLVDVPWVSHYRLGVHLMIAFLLFSCCVWFALDLYSGRKLPRPVGERRSLRKWLRLFLAAVVVQTLWGAFVAGLNAGYVYNTFPLMNHSWIPPAMWQMEPLVRNFLDNPANVQWVHRWLGIALVAAAFGLFLKVWFTSSVMQWRGWAALLLSVVTFQVVLGIITLLMHVPLVIAVMHQAVAMLLFGILIAWIHRLGMTRSEVRNADLQPS